MWSDVIPFLGKKDKQSVVVEEARKWQPVLEIKLDRKVYRPGDAVTASIEIRNIAAAVDAFQQSIEVRELVVEVKGTEKLDQQWIVVPKPSSTSGKQRIGERLFLHGQSHIVLNKHVERDSSRGYLIQTTLPKILPPSYRGTAVRYFYYLTVRLQWSFKARGDSSFPEPFAVPLEKRVSLTVWTLPGFSGLTADELQLKENYNIAGIVPTSTVEVDTYWRENTDGSEWSRASGPLSSLEDDVSSQGSDSRAQSPVKGVLEQTFERSLLLSSPSLTSKSLNRTNSRRATLLTASSSDTCIDKEGSFLQTQTSLHRSCSENGVSWRKLDGYISEDGENAKSGSPLGERHIKGKAYNIKVDNQVLVQVSPKNPDATYYFGDTVAGVISFPSDSGLRRKCLEVSAILEVREILNPSYLHPSRRNSQVISKVHAEYFEVVADVSQTHYIFSIPLDGPASFSTPHISLQWVLRFEFLSTWANADWSKVDHPLQVKERDKGEWVMPITVHAPLPKTRGFRKERPVSSLRDFWMQSPKASSEWGGTPQGSPFAAAGPSNGHL